ncbi:hypothetical protein C8R34_10626 [Nitrosomonas sp. Nm84]|uniref:hypothetical protein n=1 Tax=Nitrosomonas sp. Nm84 TaxID=200124 RepID=UPI000D76C4FF|nr:hypothetical protein [Nitrosomonas sp. Nm84]PXW88880.1 hypothetical protein C8R34_10626 [Nitrosomonas sp. Nm84]
MSESKDYYKYEVAKDETEAKDRFKEFSSKDPLPEVRPALLNSGDIYDYARITSMVFPFDENNEKKKLKSASYEIDFMGEVHYINEKTGKSECEYLVRHRPFILKKNSIVFLYIETKFFLPDYIAIRFNLKITHVHRGLLLGTGPLVDPGFVGRLLIPLHNLTSEDYVIKGGEGLIWVEFTKLSPHRNWSSSARKNSANYIKFPERKSDIPVREYFYKASLKGEPANSSIPGEIKKTRDDFKKYKTWTLGGGIVLFVSILSVVLPSVSLIKDAFEKLDEARNLETSMRKELNNSKQKIESLEIQIESLTELMKKTERNFNDNQ